MARSGQRPNRRTVKRPAPPAVAAAVDQVLAPAEKQAMVQNFAQQLVAAGEVVHEVRRFVVAHVLTNELARAAMERLIEHGTDLREMHEEGATASAEEIRATLDRIARDAADLVLTFDDRAAATEAQSMHQGEASL